MRKRRISVLTLQETHLTKKHVEEIHTIYGKRLRIFHSSNPERPSERAGVVVVLNRELVKTEEAEITELIPGQALLLQAPWHAETWLTWLVIYAPNKTQENQDFWIRLTEIWEEWRLPKPDGMSGDFNFVEDAIDRLPVHGDNTELVTTFKALKESLRLCDGW